VAGRGVSMVLITERVHMIQKTVDWLVTLVCSTLIARSDPIARRDLAVSHPIM
jgi:hypothetical protein